MSQIDSWSISSEIFGEIKKFEKPAPREISDWMFPSPQFQISDLIPEKLEEPLSLETPRFIDKLSKSLPNNTLILELLHTFNFY